MKSKYLWIVVLSLLLVSCASLFTKYNKKELNDHKEFDSAIQVEEFKEEPPVAESQPAAAVDQATEVEKKAVSPAVKSGAITKNSLTPGKKALPSVEKKMKSIPEKSKSPKAIANKIDSTPAKKVSQMPAVASGVSSAKDSVKKVVQKPTRTKAEPTKLARTMEAPAKPTVKVPALEDAEGFIGRRPAVDPLRVGEKIVLSINYFKVEAGRFTLSVKPFKKVNGKKSYHLHYTVKTSSLFSLFYKVDDVAETFVDYDLWRPFSYEIHVKQSKQVRETKSFFNWKTMKGVYLDRKKAPDKPLKKSKREWDVLNWSQNVFSVAYYLRAHTLRVGKTVRVRVGHEGKNLVMSAKVLRKEKINTAVGEFEAFVVQPTFTVDGLFKATGNNLLWLSADERKFFLRLESKIKIGTIVGEIEELRR